MDSQAYLDRIAYSGGLACDLRTLEALVSAHLLNVPFENFDIHLGVPIQLQSKSLFNKIVARRRGGFCYELNTLFAELLCELGYKVDLLAARVYRENVLGPAFDHMALRVHIAGKSYLVDVGFGEASTGPLELRSGARRTDRDSVFSLSKLADGLAFECTGRASDAKAYALSLKTHQLDDFAPMCLHHQRSARSWFTRERICILLSDSGALSLIEGKLRHPSYCRKIVDDQEYLEILESQFGLQLAGLPPNSSSSFAMRFQMRALSLEDRAKNLISRASPQLSGALFSRLSSQ